MSYVFFYCKRFIVPDPSLVYPRWAKTCRSWLVAASADSMLSLGADREIGETGSTVESIKKLIDDYQLREGELYGARGHESCL